MDKIPEKFLRAREIFLENHGWMRTSEAKRSGIHPVTLYQMRDNHFLVQEGSGLYRLPDLDSYFNFDLIRVSFLMPKAVVCLISALAFYELTTQIPQQVYITLSAKSLPRLENRSAFNITFRRGLGYSAGIERHLVDGFEVAIYSREKTIADCFRFQDKVGEDVALEALKEYRRRGKMNIQALLRYAQINKVTELMESYLKVLTA